MAVASHVGRGAGERAQGFYFGRPVEAEEMERLLTDDPATAKAPS